jgi:hypothetical protein
MTALRIKTWKRVTVGRIGTFIVARERLKTAEIKVSSFADDIIFSIMYKNTKAKLDLVRVSAKEIGLGDGVNTAEIYAAGERHGLCLCPAEVAPQLWIQYPDLLPRGERLHIAMEAFKHSYCGSIVFHLEYCSDDRWLGVNYGEPCNTWKDDSIWVFVRK